MSGSPSRSSTAPSPSTRETFGMELVHREVIAEQGVEAALLEHRRGAHRAARAARRRHAGRALPRPPRPRHPSRRLRRQPTSTRRSPSCTAREVELIDAAPRTGVRRLARRLRASARRPAACSPRSSRRPGDERRKRHMKVSIGFAGGQVLAVRVSADALEKLPRTALGGADRAGSSSRSRTGRCGSTSPRSPTCASIPTSRASASAPDRDAGDGDRRPGPAARRAHGRAHPRARSRRRGVLGARPARRDLARLRRRRARSSPRPSSAAAGGARPRPSPGAYLLQHGAQARRAPPAPAAARPAAADGDADPAELPERPRDHARLPPRASSRRPALPRCRSTCWRAASPPRASISACTTPPTCSPARCSAPRSAPLSAGRSESRISDEDRHRRHAECRQVLAVQRADAAGAEAANYPFTTIEPNVAVVAVPTSASTRLAELLHASDIVYDTISFHDIAGLVAGAHRGEGLGNRFLANIRETDAILHVVRAHADANVDPPRGSRRPARRHRDDRDRADARRPRAGRAARRARHPRRPRRRPRGDRRAGMA